MATTETTVYAISALLNLEGPAVAEALVAIDARPTGRVLLTPDGTGEQGIAVPLYGVSVFAEAIEWLIKRKRATPEQLVIFTRIMTRLTTTTKERNKRS